MKRAFCGLMLSGLLAACAGQPTQDAGRESREAAYRQRVSLLEAVPVWSLTARLGVDDGEDGGSGRLQWGVDGAKSTLDFRGTLGQGAWRLALDETGATLSRADGSVAHDPSVTALVNRESGMNIPVEALHWWVRGMARPDAVHHLELDEGGRPMELNQEGWLIRFSRYTELGSLMLPRKLEATRGDYRVKLAISSWYFPDGDSDA